MTLTNKELEFYDMAAANTFSYNVKYNVLVLLSCNVIAFMAEGGDSGSDRIVFIKNPVFSKTDNDVSEASPFGLVSIRSWSPIWGMPKSVANEFVGIKDTYKNAAGQDIDFFLSEETVFLFNKESRKILAMSQLRLRVMSDQEEINKSNFYKNKEYIMLHCCPIKSKE
jgi:hypothetical protein